MLTRQINFAAHGYNVRRIFVTMVMTRADGSQVWVPSIDDGINVYNLSINQPAGLQYMLTMWGSSGIRMAGTTDVLSGFRLGD
jgi:hypothetical protein